MTPHEYASTIALPTLQEFLADRASYRRAFLACMAVYHTVDYLAQARVAPGLPKGAFKIAKDREAQAIRDAVADICAAPFAVLKGMCNGTKHAKPTQTQSVPALAFDSPGAGWDQGRWEVPGLKVEHDGGEMFVDWCAQAVMLTLRALYGADLDLLDLTFCDAAFRGAPGWQEPPDILTEPAP